jgi:TPR repeat protein
MGTSSRSPRLISRSRQISPSKHWAERAAAHGSAEAHAILGRVLTGGPAEVRDRVRGEQYYQDPAAAGRGQGRLGWALVLLHRRSLKATHEAREHLEKASAANLFAHTTCWT